MATPEVAESEDEGVTVLAAGSVEDTLVADDGPDCEVCRVLGRCKVLDLIIGSSAIYMTMGARRSSSAVVWTGARRGVARAGQRWR